MHTRIATCCYCGTRAALVLDGTVQHELACSSCGAPLSQMKNLKTTQDKPRRAKPSKPAYRRSDTGAEEILRALEKRAKKGRKKKKPKKGLAQRMLGEAFDALEDLFD